MKQSNPIALFSLVEPYLDRLFPGWKLVELSGSESIHRQGYVVISTPSQYVRMVRNYDEDTLAFAPDESYENRGTSINVAYLQWLLRDRPSRQLITDQLDWLEMHYAWKTRWQNRQVFDEFVRIYERHHPLLMDFSDKYFGTGNNLWPEFKRPTVPELGQSESLALSPLFIRTSGYFPLILGQPWQAYLRPEALYAVGERMSLRIHIQNGEEVLSVRPSKPDLDEPSTELLDDSSVDRCEWLDVSRVTQTFDREMFGRTVEPKLVYLARYVGNYQRICRPESFPHALFLIGQAEEVNAAIIRVLTGSSDK